MLKTVAKSYWRCIQRGTRTFDSVPNDNMKTLVKELAADDVAAGVITVDDYKTLIGEDYAPAE